MYPRVPLSKAVEYATKLVSKTHTGPQPRSIIGPGVFGASGTGANERISALRQYGLLLGTDSDGYEASDSAKDLIAAVEKQELLQQACLKSALFQKLHQTFLGDTITRPRIKQQILSLKVHPDSAEECLNVTIGTFLYCGLWKDAGNDTIHVPAIAQSVSQSKNVDPSAVGEPKTPPPEIENKLDDENPKEESDSRPDDLLTKTQDLPGSNHRRSAAHLEIKIDPSMDPEKLERLLAVLKKYGQI